MKAQQQSVQPADSENKQQVRATVITEEAPIQTTLKEGWRRCKGLIIARAQYEAMPEHMKDTAQVLSDHRGEVTLHGEWDAIDEVIDFVAHNDEIPGSRGIELVY